MTIAQGIESAIIYWERYKAENNIKHGRDKVVLDNLTCTKCNIEQPTKNFHKSSTSVTGFSYVCKACRKVVDARRFQNRQREKAKLRENCLA